MPLCKSVPYTNRRCSQGLTSFCVIISQCGYFAGLLQAGGSGGGARAPQVFGRTVNPISTKWQIMPTTVPRAPQYFQTLRCVALQFGV